MDQAAFDNLAARVYKIADQVHTHEVKMGEHGVLIDVMTTHVEGLRSTMATRDQLSSAEKTIKAEMTTAVSAAKEQLENAVGLMTLKVQYVHDDLEPIKRGVYGVVWLVVGAVVIALIALVVKK